MKRMAWAPCLAAFFLAMSNHPAVQAAVVRPLAFDELVRQAALIVRGNVVETRSYVRGVGVVRNEAQKEGRPPVSDPGKPGTPEAPQSAGTRGGRMIFTHVVLRTNEASKGDAGQTVEFDIAGGTVDGRTVWIPSLPTFDRGGDYVLFLREGYENAGDPILGVNQGFFRVAITGTPDAVLNSDFDYVARSSRTEWCRGSTRCAAPSAARSARFRRWAQLRFPTPVARPRRRRQRADT